MSRGPKTELTLQSLTETPDGSGGVSESWTSVRQVSGVLVSSRGDEKLVASKVNVYSTHVFYCDEIIGIGLNERYRFVSRSRTFEIVFVDEIRNGDLRIDLVEVR